MKNRHVVPVAVGVALMLMVTSGAWAVIETLEALNSVDELRWLAGCWASTDDGTDDGTGEDGTRTEECWMAPAGGLMLGVHRSIRDGQPAWFEYLRIQEGAGEILSEGIVYRASPGGKPATAFFLIAASDQHVVFENTANDFPQRIIYQRDGETLHARAEGEVDGVPRVEKWVWTRVRFPDGDH